MSAHGINNMKKLPLRVVIFFLIFIRSLVPVSANATTPAVSTGNSHVLALKDDGTLRSWGTDSFGQLGIGTQISLAAPTGVAGMPDIVDVEAGDGFNLALDSQGNVWAWGSDALGQLGDGTTSDRPQPGRVSGLSGVTAIAAGSGVGLAVKSDGTVWAWGINTRGELGTGKSSGGSNLPVQVPGIANIVAVAGGSFHSMALQSNGTVWAWGSNDYGQVGNGTFTESDSPAKVIGLPVIKQISAGRGHSVAVGADGTLWVWGLNGNSQLGDGTTISRNTPEKVVGLSNVAFASAGGTFTVAVIGGGTMWGWGNNLFGMIGDGTQVQRSTPVQALISNVAFAVAGQEHVAALKNDGTVWTWGENGAGQLGDGTTADRYTPQIVPGLANINAVSAGAQDTVVATVAGGVLAWGANSSGQLGFGVTDNRSTPQTITALANVVQIVAGGEHSVALTSDGNVWTWGSNSAQGQLGDGTTAARSLPIQVPISNVVGISANMYHTVAVRSDGTVWAWGSNAAGQLGNGTYTNSFSPTQATISNVVAVAAGTYHTLALEADGTVWAWGNNGSGQFGNATTTNNPTPTQVPQFFGAVAIAAGAYYSLALVSDGSVWGWGDNFYGQLGLGNTGLYYTGARKMLNVANAVGISAGVFHSLVVLSNGTVLATGQNNNGQLGDGTTTDRSSVVPVAGLTNVAGVAAGKFGNRTSYFSAAIKYDGTVVSWGDNYTGQLSDGTYAQRLAPEVVLHEGGSGTLQTNDWFLDLLPGAVKNIPASQVPKFEIVGTKSGDDMSTTVSTTIKFNPPDVGTSGSVFVVAMVPAGSPLAGGAHSFVASAVADAPKLIDGRMRASARNRTAAASAATTYVQVQLTPSGWQPVVNGQLMPFVSGVLGSALASQTILNNVDTTQLRGAQVCLGYGSNASAMVSNGTIRSAVSVDGAPVGTVVSCIPGSASSFAPQTGYWWNPAEGGRGFTIEQGASGNLFFATYLYSANGTPVWYAAGPSPMSGLTFSQPMLAYANGQTLSGAYQQATQGTSPGNVSIMFSDASHATLTWPGGTIPIQRYEFEANGLNLPPTGSQPQSGYWWNPSEGGRGYTVEVQSNAAFIAAYMYDDFGNPVWYASGPIALSGSTYQGMLTSYAGGQTLTGTFHSPTSTSSAGNITIQFATATTGTLTLPNGRQIPIQRYGF